MSMEEKKILDHSILLSGRWRMARFHGWYRPPGYVCSNLEHHSDGQDQHGVCCRRATCHEGEVPLYRIDPEA
jgi:hypothetical protein